MDHFLEVFLYCFDNALFDDDDAGQVKQYLSFKRKCGVLYFIVLRILQVWKLLLCYDHDKQGFSRSTKRQLKRKNRIKNI